MSFGRSENSQGNSTSGWVAAGFLIALILLAANYKLISGEALPQWDAVDQFGPAFSLIADHIKAHHLLLWNPWISAGSPDFAEPQFGVSSPIVLAIGFLAPDAQSGFVTYWMFMWTVGALGMFALAKHLGAPIWGAVVVALGFATSGYFTGHGEHTPYIYSVSLLPAVLWRFDAALVRRRIWFGVQAGGLYGLSTLGGYPAFTILTFFFLAFWTIGRIVWPENDPASGYRPAGIRAALVSLLLAVSLGALISAPIYLGFRTHTLGYSDVTGPRPREQALTSNVFPPAAFSTVASPYLPLLNFNPGAIWPETDVSMCSIYMGSGIVGLALFALLRSAKGADTRHQTVKELAGSSGGVPSAQPIFGVARDSISAAPVLREFLNRNKWRWWLATIAVLFGCCSVGYKLPLRGWLYDFVIPFRYFRNASDFTAYVILVLAILAAYGARDLTTAREKRAHQLFLSVAVASACGAIAAFQVVLQKASHPVFSAWITFGRAHMLFAWIGLIAVGLPLYLGLLSPRWLGTLFVVLASLDAVMTIQISKPLLYTEATVAWWHAMNTGSSRLDLPTLARSDLPPPELGTYRNNRNIDQRIATFQGYNTLDNRFYQAFLQDPQLTQVATGAKRICFASGPVWLTPNDANFSRFVTRWHSAGSPILVLHGPESMQDLSDKSTQNRSSDVEITNDAICSPVAVADVSYFPNSLSFSYMADRVGWLLVTDRWAPGWNVRINGKLQRPIGGDFIFRAVPMTPGLNRIEFHYEPAGFVPLLILSWFLLGAIVCVELVRCYRWLYGDESPAATSSWQTE